MNLNLRDHLLDALAKLPGSRTFHLHVLLSSPRKFSELYPYATPTVADDGKQRRPPRVYAQDVLVVVSEEVSGQRVLVVALEAAVFNIPSSKSLVISIVKVDTTARGKRPAPTKATVLAFVGFFVDPKTRLMGGVERVWVHLFARSQGQYLFPNSSQFEGKKVLSPEKLCKWWKAVLSGITGPDSHPARYWWLIPGLDEEEALQAIGELHAGSSPSTSGRWTYGHPYSQKDVPLPYVQDETATPYNLGHFIPSFDDDPKTRFMDEIACTTQVDGVRSPKKKRLKTSKQADASTSSQGKDEEDEIEKKGREKESRPHGELGKVRPDEFWERMSFRQECISGALTGFFVAVFPCPSSSSPTVENPLAPKPGQVSFQMNRRILMSMRNTDFSTMEGAVRGTEVLENAIRGMCEGSTAITTTTASTSSGPPPRLEPSELPPPSADRRTPERETKRSQLAPPGNGSDAFDDVSPNPFPEPVASTDTYHSYIYGSIRTANTEQTAVASSSSGSSAPSGTQKVTELVVRKKTKKKI